MRALLSSCCSRFSGGTLPCTDAGECVQLEGDAWLDPEFGVKVDGEGDGIALGPTSAEGWSGDDDFTISFAFTKGHCRIPGDYEFLFSSFGECHGEYGGSSNPSTSCSVTGGRNAGINIFLGCDNDRANPSSTVDTSDRDHAILRIMLTDDSLQRAQFDVDLNLGRSGAGGASSAWVHLALAVTKNSITTFVDGEKVSNDNIGYAQGGFMDWAVHRDNIALGDPERLRSPLSAITLQGGAYLGTGHPFNSWSSGQGYAGAFAGVQLLKGALKAEDAMCLYQVSAQHAGQCPTFTSLFSGGQGAPWRNGAMADGHVGPDLAYVQTPHQMITEELMGQTTDRAMDGPSVTMDETQATPANAIAACAAICRGIRRPGPDGYPYMGLQYKNTCFCGDVYDKTDGTGRLDSRTGDMNGECDMNGDQVPDCGMGIDSEGAANPNACNWRNAVFDLNDDQEATCTAASAGRCDAAGRYSSPGFEDRCTAAGQCVYTPADTTVEIEPAACKPIGWDYCPNVDLNGRYMTTQCSDVARPDWEVTGGCQYDAGSGHDKRKCLEGGHFDNDCRGSPSSVTCTDGFIFTITNTMADAFGSADYTCTNPDPAVLGQDLPASCTTITTDLQCSGGTEDTCGGMTGCAWVPKVTQQESCVARDADACAAVQLGSADSEAACTSAAPECIYTDASTPRFIGCYQDSEGTGGSAIQLAGNTQANEDYGLTFDGEDDWAVITAEGAGNYAAEGVFSICFYFTRNDCLAWRTDEWQALYSHQGIGTYPRGGSLDFPARTDASGVATWDITLQDSIELYLGCSADGAKSTVAGDFIRILAGDHANNKVAFDISTTSERAGGYVTDTWAHLAVSFDGPGQSINSYVDGQQVTSFGFSNVHDGDDWAQSTDNLAYPNPNHLTAPMGNFVLAGGSNGPVLANDRPGGRAEFLGSMTFVTLWTRALSQNEAACLFLAQNEHVEVCQRPTEGHELNSNAWHEDLSVDKIRSDVQLGQNAWFDPGYGLTLDGIDDFMAISPAPSYTDDGTFTISFWYTRTQCTIPGSYETLYSQHQSWITGEDAGARVDLVIGCGQRSEEDSVDGSTIEGNVIRASLRDNDGTRASFDIPLTAERMAEEGGFVSDMWAHFVLSVGRTGVRTYMDGSEIAWNRYGFRNYDRDPLANVAFPNPTQFQGDNAFSGFSMRTGTPRSYGTVVTPEPGLTYLGCFSDAYGDSHMWNDRPSVDMDSSSMTVAACGTQCSSDGFQYMGLEWGGYCFCGNTPPGSPSADGTAHSMEDSDSACSLGCRGDPTFACGGRSKLSAYRIEDVSAISTVECDWLAPIHNYQGPELDYLGCYRDGDRNRNFFREPRRPGQDGYYGPPAPSPSDTTDNIEQISTGYGRRGPTGSATVAGREASEWDTDNGNRVAPMHIELCGTLCNNDGYEYMALFDGTNCYCSHTHPDDVGATRDDEAGCNDACPADITQICGDGGNSKHSSVYRINAEQFPLPANVCARRTPPPTIVFGHNSGNTGLGNSGGFSGSIAQIQLFSRNIDIDEAECLYHFGQSEVATCKAAVMLPGVQYFQTFLPPEMDTGTDMVSKLNGQSCSGDTCTNSGGSWDGFATPTAFRTCVEACQADGKMYAGMTFNTCSCGNDYRESLGGRVENQECATVPQQNGHCAWADADCADEIELNPGIREESCAATDLETCSDVMNAAPDQITGDRRGACEAAGKCTYTPEASYVSVSDAGCYSKSVEYCATTAGRPSAMDNHFVETICGMTPHPEWGIVGGCIYTPTETGDRFGTGEITTTPASCVANVTHAECAASLAAMPFSATTPLSDQCAQATGCEWREATTQQEDCVATDKDICAAAHSLSVGLDDAMSDTPQGQALCTGMPGTSCTYIGRRDSADDRNCHRDANTCEGSCNQRVDYPARWCAPGSFPAPPPPPQPDHAECGWKSIGDLIASTPGGFSGWNGAATSPPCFQRMAVYAVGRSIGSRYIADRSLPVWQPHQPMGQYRGCYRTAGSRPAGITLRGDAYFDNEADAGNIDSGWAGMTMGEPHTSINDGARDMGIHFDGEGDFAEIDPTQGDGIPGGGRASDYALDGTFTVSLWATQPDCNVKGREEWLYAHTKYKDRWIMSGSGSTDSSVNSAIAIAYLCTENGAHSTAPGPTGGGGGRGGGRAGVSHLIRVYLVDDDANKAVFDVPLNGYSNPWHNSQRNGDFITQTWVHIAIASNGTSVIPYIDGHRVPENVLGVPPDRSLTGARYIGCSSSDIEAGTCDTVFADQANNWQDSGWTSAQIPDRLAEIGTPTAQQACQSLCSNFQYFGLEWSRGCFCGDNYQGTMVSPADPNFDGDDNEFTTPCDPDGDGTPNCGLGVSGVCSGNQAIFSRAGQYQGCFTDPGSGGVSLSQNMAWSADLGRADIHNMALGTFTLTDIQSLDAAAESNPAVDPGVAASTGLVSQGCFAGEGRNFDGWTRGRSIAWNFNSLSSTMADRTSPTWGPDGEFSRYRGRGPGRRMSPAICASLCWDDSTDESCEPLDDSAVDADCDFQRGDSTSCNAAVCAYTPPGTTRILHTSFVIGRDGRCACGNGRNNPNTMTLADGPWRCNSACSDDSTLACGGRARGVGGAPGQEYFSLYSFDVDASGPLGTPEVLAELAPKPWEQLPKPLGVNTPMYLGGHESFRPGGSESGAFVGNIADFGLFNRGIDDKEMDCLFRQTKRTLGACTPVQRGLAVHGWTGGCTHGNGNNQNLNTINGMNARDALCGRGTNGVATVPILENGFADDGRFTLSFWFDKRWCETTFNATAGEGGSSTLLAWGGGNNCGGGGGVGLCRASVSVQLVCPHAARPSNLIGAALRIHIVSDNGKSYETDVSTRNELDRGLVTDKWANLMLSVQNDKVDVYVDEILVQFRQRWGGDSQPGLGEMGFPNEYINGGGRSPLACADGYMFQRADGRNGRPQDNSCGGLGGCVDQLQVRGQTCDQPCDQQCANAYDQDNIGYPDPVYLDGRFDRFRTLPPTISVGGYDLTTQADSTFILTSDQYTGDINGVMAFNRNLGDEDRRCVYKQGLVKVDQ
jgi:hypothetical protein